ncbi:MAG: ABC transporter [Bacteroidetes bacterium SW_8_64_56]|nr:MAG: ABC transporter [Bacteroidetes bacterium SW_8_64_56]
MALLSVDQLTVTLDGHTILRDVGFDVPAGRWVGVLGPNGAGKTTLLRAIGGHIPFEGDICLEGVPNEDLRAQKRARTLAFVRQARSLTFDFTVEEFVLLGRAPHRGWFQAYRASDQDRVRETLARVDLEDFGHRSVLSLSGGEMQRVFLAQALVQDADLLLLDEPTAHLDVHYQFSFMDRVRTQVAEGRTVLAVGHDLELAARYADRLLLLDEGKLRAEGPPAAVLTPDRIAKVFGMRAEVDRHPNGTLRIDYLGPIASSSTSKKTSRPDEENVAFGRNREPR